LTTSKRRRQTLALYLLGVLFLVGGASWFFRADFDIWNSRLHDALFTLREARGTPLPADPDLVFVDIDDASYEAVGNSWFSRRSYAHLVRVFQDLGVRAVLFDVAFIGSTEPEDDAELVSAVRSYGRAYIPLIVAIDPPGEIPAFSKKAAPPATVSPEGSPWLAAPNVKRWGDVRSARGVVKNLEGLDRAAKGVGHITSYPDRDGVYRRMRLAIRDGERIIPSLTLRAAMDLLGVADDGVTLTAGEAVRLRGADGRETMIPVDGEACTAVNLAGRWDAVFPHYSGHRLLAAQTDPALMDQLAEALEGAVVVVSDSSTRGQDFGTTPIEKIYPKGGLHLNLLNNILTGRFIREYGRGAALIASTGAAAVLLFVGSLLGGSVLGGMGFVAVCVALLAALAGGALGLFFHDGILFPVLEPVLVIVLGSVTVLGCRYFWSERDRALLRNSFESYLPAPVLDKVLRSPDLLFAVQRKTLTVLFSDIAGFTKWCSTQSPSAIHATLNAYFKEMTEIVFAHGGTVDKYIGDGLMVFFGDPIDQPDHAVRAVRCAVEMQRRCRELAEEWGAEGGLRVRIRVGVNTGEVAVGNMGSQSRMDYTVIGAEVNLSQRLEANAPVGSVLMSSATHEAVQDAVPCRFHGEIAVKGYDMAIKSYEVDWTALGESEPS
jgi:adenylate cyclase